MNANSLNSPPRLPPTRRRRDAARRSIALAFVLGCGAVVAATQSYTLFLLPQGTYFANHAGTTLLPRVLEFRDCLAAGYWFPQWCTNFRQGFGSPYFSYYPPGFFYAASAVPPSVGLVRATAITVFAFSLAGYLFTFLLVARRFGTAAGVLAGSGLVLAEYASTNLYIRGDFSEFSAMMLIPVALFCLDEWVESPNRASFGGLALSSGLIVVTHCCIALASFAFLLIYLLAFSVPARTRRAAFVGVLALALGAGLAAFYWFPVMFEWNLVSPSRAFSGVYHFSGHFVQPLDLLVYRNRADVPMFLGFGTIALVAWNFAVAARGWARLTCGQKRLLWIAGGLCTFALVLMNPCSAALWSGLPLLYRLQFPWRLLALLTPGLAILGGCLVPWRHQTPQAALACFVMLNLAFASMASSKREVSTTTFQEPRSAAEIAETHFAPDDADEWLPAGARVDREAIVERAVRPSPGATASGYRQRQGALQCDVATTRDSHIDLPHFYFPGWTARLGERDVPVTRNDDAMLRVQLPAKSAGTLVVRFSKTPMRAWGLATSVASVVLLLILMSRWRFPCK